MATNEKILNTRIALKIDTLENWNKSDLILKKGELAFATHSVDAGIGMSEPVVMVKIGNGAKKFSELSWNFHAKASDVLAACKTSEGLTSFIENVITNSKLATAADLTALTGRVSTAEGAIATLNGDENVAGSVAKAIKDAVDTLNTNIAATYVNKTDYATDKAALEKAIGDEKARAESVEGGLDIRLKAVEDDYLKAADKTELEGKITDLETESAKHALKSDVEAEFAKYTKTADLPTDLGDFTNNAGYAKTADVNTELDKKADKTQVATDIATAIAPLATTEALNGVKATAEAAATKVYVDEELAKKADKSVVDAMYTNSKIDELIEAEADRADKAEKANAAAIKAIADDYLKTADKTELEGDIEGLQTQINTIMSNPDAEGAINSINEFTQYIADHGEIAEGFRTDINKNKDDIAAEVKRAGEAEAALDKRLDDVEAVLGTGEGTVTEQIADAVAEAKGYTDTKLGAITEGKTVAEEIAAAQTAATNAANANTTEVLKDYYTKEAAAEAFMDATETGAAIDEKIAALKLGETYDAKGAAATAETNAKAYADGLAGNYATKDQGATADSALQTVKVLGTELSKNSNELTVEAAKTALGLGTAAYKPASDFATAAQGSKADTALQAADITTGSANGTIAVQGTDVAVKGLGSAAYTDTSAYATAAQGAKADTAVQNITAPAGNDGSANGLKVEHSGNNVTIGFDPDVVFIFNCGDSGVVTE